jgi:uncharacterized protein YjbI with pentapeptide repeats
MKSAGAERANPDDVSGLQASLNDSATRVSAIWITYLLFGLYLLVAAGTANHRQILLEEGLKLPALGTDVPLFWFFVLSPALFVLLHIYVLLQVLLLGRTALAYSKAVDRTTMAPQRNAIVRQRLANTLFAQLFAGSPRERRGWLGELLHGIAWITLVGGPVLIILALQVAFLPYHSSFATWTHRTLLLLELVIAFAYWPIVLDPERDLSWQRVSRDLRRVVTRPLRFAVISNLGPRAVPLTARRLLPALACLVAIWLSFFVFAFPGEPHINVLTFRELNDVDCDSSFIPHLDRLILKDVSVVDPQKHKHLFDLQSRPSFLRSWEGERTRSFAGRDLSCGVFEFADFRMTSFVESRLAGANLENARLDWAVMIRADLRNARLNGISMESINARQATFRDAKMAGSQLQRAVLKGTTFIGADVSLANLGGADFGSYFDSDDPKLAKPAQLQGINLSFSDIAGAFLDNAQLQGATLIQARLDGASLFGASLKAADLGAARLQGVNLSNADLSLTRFDGAYLQGALLKEAELDESVVAQSWLWQAREAQCAAALVSNPHFDAKIAKPSAYNRKDGAGKPNIVEDSPENREALISAVPEGDDYRPRDALKEALSKDDPAALRALMQACAHNIIGRRSLDTERRAKRIGLEVCQAPVSYRKAFAAGAIRSAINQERNPDDYRPSSVHPDYLAALAGELLPCVGSQLEQKDREELERRKSSTKGP